MDTVGTTPMLLVLLRIAATTLSKRGPIGTPRVSVKDGNGISCLYFVKCFLFFLLFYHTALYPAECTSTESSVQKDEHCSYEHFHTNL